MGGIVLGAVAGTLALASAALTAVDTPSPVETLATGIRDVLHAPPLLVRRGEAVRLRYDVVCRADELGAPCPIGGTLFVRNAGERTTRRITLESGRDSTLTATLDASATDGAGFAYYAEISDGLGNSRIIPSGGATAPQQAWVVERSVDVDLGAHEFGHTRQPDARVVQASWGARSGSLGLIGSPQLARIGPSAFDIAPDGSVVVLDQGNHRLAAYPAGGKTPRYVPIPFAGAEGDLAVDGDGAVHVLDLGAAPIVRTFTGSGTPAAAIGVGEHAPDMLRPGPGGPLLHGYPGDLWFPIQESARALPPAGRASRARAGRSVGGGLDIVVHGGMHEASFAVVHGDRVLRAWRLRSGTPLGEVQLAEPFAGGLLAVVRLWDDETTEFLVLVLSPTGTVRSFSVDSAEWAESAALSRFRLDRSTLYQLRSAPTGVEIVTFDVGGSA